MTDVQVHSPGDVRNAIVEVLRGRRDGVSVQELCQQVEARIGPVPPSSVRSYLNANTPVRFTRLERGRYRLASTADTPRAAPAALQQRSIGRATLVHADCLDWLSQREANSLHAVVTDPPYGVDEYSPTHLAKMRQGSGGGVWRIPPSFDGSKRAPLPRFTVMNESDIKRQEEFFAQWARILLPALVPGAHVFLASNPLLSHRIATALHVAGLEPRGQIIRQVMTMRGGDRPKGAHNRFSNVTVMPRSAHEPWIVFRKRVEGTVAKNLDRWGTGGLRRESDARPFCDVIPSSPTRQRERSLAPHPSLKPQAFMRELVRASLPLGTGVVCDPFAGAGSTLAAAEALGYESIGIEQDSAYFELACGAIPKLAALDLS